MTIAPSGAALGSGTVPSVPEFADAFVRHLTLGRGVEPADASREDRYAALAATVRDVLTARRLHDPAPHGKTVCYLSAEYLLGRQLDNALQATGLSAVAAQALASCGVDLGDLRAVEPEPGLGNGGLGRLAACFADSLATAGIPSVGYGIRYDYGLFRQTFVDGRQVERPDRWLASGTPWELQRPEQAVTVSFGGRTETVDDAGAARTRWVPDVHVRAVPCDYLVPGYRGGRTNVLRLWTATAVEPFDLDAFTAGRYADAVRAQTFAQTITRVLYPEDSTPEGKALRLRQQYFFAAAAVRDAVDRALADGAGPERLPERLVFQLNDTHPVIAVPELMRILVDDGHQDWDAAWSITRRCFAYTCHTLLPEALEEWPERLINELLPRHGEIIRRIDDDFQRDVRARLGDGHARRMAIVTAHRTVRMAHLAVMAATTVNGVARLHSRLLRERVLPDFDAFFPGRFTNVTNGVTPRRFLLLANPGLSALITDTIGPGWETDLDRLRELEPAADDAEFRRRFRAVKADNKRRLAAVLRARDGMRLDTGHLLDVMVKRVHEYKRQMLKLLHVVSVLEGVRSGRLDAAQLLPRTVVFGGKAAPGYVMAKRTIHLINAVAAAVDAEPLLAGRLRVLYPPNYDVSLAEAVIPAADVSEQISLAGLEASGTGNMKLALNGALTVGTDDGANVEIRELVGDDDFFLFGMSEPEAHARREAGYRPGDVYDADPVLRAAVDAIASGAFSDGDRGVFEPVVSELLHGDRFMVLADFAAYARCQDRVDAAYADADAWARAAIVNVARCGRFSSDRSIRDYAADVWHVAAASGR